MAEPFGKILTQRLEDFRSSKFTIKKHSVVLCVKEATHSDQNHLHGALRKIMKEGLKAFRREKAIIMIKAVLKVTGN